MRLKSVGLLSLIFFILSTPTSNAWILQSKNFPIAISDIGPDPDDDVKDAFPDGQRCVSGSTGVFAFKYSEDNASGTACVLHIYFPDKTKGSWHLQVLVNEGKWIDAWNSNMFRCGDAGDLGLANCKRGPSGSFSLYKSDSLSNTKSVGGEKIDSIKIGKKTIWTSNFEIPRMSSKGICQVFSGNIDFRIRATLPDSKSIFSPPFTIVYSGDNSWKKYSNGAGVCNGSNELDGQGNPYPVDNPDFAKYTPTSRLKANWDSFKVVKPINISQATVSTVSKKLPNTPVASSKPSTTNTSTCSKSDKSDYTNVYRTYVLYNQQISISNEIKQNIEDARQKISKILGRFTDYTAKDLYDLNKQDADIAKYEAKRDALQPLLLKLAIKCNLKMPSTTDLS